MASWHDGHHVKKEVVEEEFLPYLLSYLSFYQDIKIFPGVPGDIILYLIDQDMDCLPYLEHRYLEKLILKIFNIKKNGSGVGVEFVS